MQLSLSTLLALATTTFASSCNATGPKPAPSPPLTRLFTAKVLAGASVPIGATYQGNRTALPIAGGSFSGLLNGKVLPFGADVSIVRPNGRFSPDGTSVFQTDDGANLLLRLQGFESKDGYIYGHGSLETGADKYDWLNYVVLVSRAKFSTDANVGLEVFCVSGCQMATGTIANAVIGWASWSLNDFTTTGRLDSTDAEVSER